MKDLKHFVTDEQGGIVAAFKQGVDASDFVQRNQGRGYETLTRDQIGMPEELKQSLDSWDPATASTTIGSRSAQRQPAG